MKKYRIKKLIIKILDRIFSEKVIECFLKYYYRHFFQQLEELNKEFPCVNIQDTINKENVKRILIVRLDAIGDIVWTTPLIRELKCGCFNSKIDLIVRPQVYDLVSNCPYLSNIYVYDCDVRGDVITLDYDKVRSRVKKFTEQNLGKHYDMVILPREVFCNSGFDNLLFAFYSRSKYRIARSYSLNKFQKVRSRLLSKYFSLFLEVNKTQHEVEQILQIAESIGCMVNKKNMELWLGDDIDFEIKKQKYIVIGLQGSSPNRNYDPLKYKYIFNKIEEKNKDVLFVLCGDDKAKEAAEIASINCKNVIDMTGKTSLNGLLHIIDNSIGYVGADTGIMHIAAALNKPVVEISAHINRGDDMSAGAPKRVGPYGVPSIVLEIPTSSGDCIDDCMEDKSACINFINKDDVIQAIESIMRI